jgi:hypothetical protein
VFYYEECSGTVAYNKVPAPVSSRRPPAQERAARLLYQWEHSLFAGRALCRPKLDCLRRRSGPELLCGTLPLVVNVSTTQSLFPNMEYVVQVSAVAGVNPFAPSPSGTAGRPLCSTTSWSRGSRHSDVTPPLQQCPKIICSMKNGGRSPRFGS